MTWSVVAELKGRGVTFDTFEMEGVEWSGEIATDGWAQGRLVQGQRRQHPRDYGLSTAQATTAVSAARDSAAGRRGMGTPVAGVKRTYADR
jgi:hypothetical protein